MKGYRAGCCEVCDSDDPTWRITRRGDVATSWTCDADLAAVCDRLQRDFEITELVVTHARKTREWSDINRTLKGLA